jgi:hypothetical protein
MEIRIHMGEQYILQHILNTKTHGTVISSATLLIMEALYILRMNPFIKMQVIVFLNTIKLLMVGQ